MEDKKLISEQALVELYRQIHTQIVRYRDNQWQIVIWAIGLLVGATAISRNISINSEWRIVIKTLAVIFEVVAASYSIWHLYFVHQALTWNRKLRQKLEEQFQFHIPGAYFSPSVLLESWKGRTINFWQGKGHLWSWWELIL